MSSGQGEAAKLWRLQELDTALHTLQQGAAPEQEKARQLAAQARQVLKQQKELEAALATARQSLRRREGDLQTLEYQIAELEKRLYGGEVTNTRELAGIEKRLQQSKEKRAQTEEQLLDLMQQVEDMEAKVSQQREHAEKLAHQLRRQETVATAESSRRRQELAKTIAERAALALQVNPEWLRRYNKISEKRALGAVARVEDGLCSGCRVSVPAGLVSAAALGGSTVYCESCGRILHVP